MTPTDSRPITEWGKFSVPETQPHIVGDPFRASVYRAVFVAAGVYNLAFGLWAGFFPLAFFRWFELEAPRYPALWACLGMVVGVYGLLYLHAARRLDHAWPIIAVGLLGKVLGPAGLLATAATTGELPPRMLSLLVFNDLVWWLPFGLFLLEGTRAGERVRASAPYAAAALHAAAGLAMLLVLRGGTEVVADVSARAAYVRDHVGAWRPGFGVWMLAGMSIAGFYAWWAARAPARRLAWLALAAAGVGLLCDLLGESLYVGWLPALANGATAGVPGALERFAAMQYVGTVLTAVFANGAYTVAGIALTLGTPSLSRGTRALAWVVWAAGAAMTAFALAGSASGLVASSGVLFPALVALCVLVGRELR